VDQHARDVANIDASFKAAALDETVLGCSYPSEVGVFRGVSMLKSVLVAGWLALVAVSAVAKPASDSAATPGQLILYQQTRFAGDYFIIDEPRLKVMTDWNIRSIALHPGEKWRVCAKPRFAEPCMILDQSLPESSVVGINGQIGSAKLIGK